MIISLNRGKGKKKWRRPKRRTRFSWFLAEKLRSMVETLLHISETFQRKYIPNFERYSRSVNLIKVHEKASASLFLSFSSSFYARIFILPIFFFFFFFSTNIILLYFNENHICVYACALRVYRLFQYFTCLIKIII